MSRTRVKLYLSFYKNLSCVIFSRKNVEQTKHMVTAGYLSVKHKLRDSQMQDITDSNSERDSALSYASEAEF